MSRLMLVTAAVCLCLATGCGGSADSLVKEQIAAMNKFADAIESGKTEATMESLKTEMEAISKKLDALKLSDTDKKALLEKHAKELGEASARLAQAMLKRAGAEMDKAMKSLPAMPDLPKLP